MSGTRACLKLVCTFLSNMNKSFWEAAKTRSLVISTSTKLLGIPSLPVILFMSPVWVSTTWIPCWVLIHNLWPSLSKFWILVPNKPSLPPGNFTFNIRPVSSRLKGETLSVDVSIARPFWSTWWFLAISFLVIVISVGLYFKHKIRTKEEEKQKELASLIKDKRLTNLKLENLRSYQSRKLDQIRSGQVFFVIDDV